MVCCSLLVGFGCWVELYLACRVPCDKESILLIGVWYLWEWRGVVIVRWMGVGWYGFKTFKGFGYEFI